MSRASVMEPPGTTVSRVSFYEWAKKTADESDEKIAGRIGVTGKTVGGWKHRDPNPRDVFEFARQYGRSIPEALRNAYGLSAADLGQRDVSPAELSDAVLIAALVNRMGVPVDELYELLGETHPSSDRLSRQDASRRKP